jgi:hypothetical protein
LVEVALAAVATLVEDVEFAWEVTPCRRLRLSVSLPEGALPAGVAAVPAGADALVAAAAGLAGPLQS